MTKRRLGTLFAAVTLAALASCRGGSHGVLPVIPQGHAVRALSAAAAPSVTQWKTGSAYAPSSITVSFATAPAVGHVLLVAFWNNAQTSGASNTYTPPAGWARVDQNTSHVYVTYQVFSHVVASGEGNSYAFTPLAAQREHLWIAADVGGASGVDKAGNAFTNTTAFTTPTLTPAQSNDVAISFNLPDTTSSVTWTNPAGWTLGAGPTSPWPGEALTQTLSAATPVSESATLSAAAPGFAGLVLLSALSVASPTPTPTPPPPTPTPTGSPVTTTAPFVSQWRSGSAYAPPSLNVSFASAPAVGDVLLVAFTNNGQSGGAPNTYTPPAGWTVVDKNISPVYATYQLFSHIVASSEANSYVFTPLAAQREHVWIAADIGHATGVDKAGDSFINNSPAFTTPSLTPAQSHDLAIGFNLPVHQVTATWTNPAGWTLGAGPVSPWNSETLYQALSSTAAVSESAMLSASSVGFAALVLLTPSNAPPTPTPTPSPALVYTDWPTFGDDIARTEYNPHETTLTAANVANLKLAWKVNLGAAITDQPLVATNVMISGTPRTVLYIGTEGGQFYALDADTHTTYWSKSLPTTSPGCTDLPGGVFGITGTATFDRSTNRVYVADADLQVHAFDMSTGAEQSGWPVSVDTTYTLDHVYSGLALNPTVKQLYVATASYCDNGTWHGRIDAIDTTSATIAHSFFPGAPYGGGGIWGLGGPAIDASGNVYVGTGNTQGGPSSSSGYGKQMVALTSALSVTAANQPGIAVGDFDFGASPTVYQPPGCPLMVSAKAKNGVLYTWKASSISSGPIQSLAMNVNTVDGQFIGATTYSAATHLFYVGVPNAVAPFVDGIVALAPQSDCTLALAWQQAVGPMTVSGNDNGSITVAGNVAYLTDGIGNEVFAFNASSGTPLWNSGTIISGATMVSPTVDGRVFVSSWDHYLYAFSF